MLLSCGLKLPGILVLGHFGSSSGAAYCQLLPVPCLGLLLYELQSDLQMFVTCPGLGGTWEGISCESRLYDVSLGLRPLSKMYGHIKTRVLLVCGL